MRQGLAAFCIAGALVASAPAAWAEKTFTIPVDKAFDDIDLTWNTGQTTYRGVWNVIVGPGNTIALCGAGATTDSRAAVVNSKWQNGMRLKLNGKMIHKGIGHFTKLKSTADPRKAKATCVSTGVKLPKGKVDLLLEAAPMNEQF